MGEANYRPKIKMAKDFTPSIFTPISLVLQM